MSKYLTTHDAAEYLGVTPSRVRQLITKKQIESDKVGRDHLIREATLKYFVEHDKKKRGRPRKTQKQ